MADDPNELAKALWRSPAGEHPAHPPNKPRGPLWVIAVVLASLFLPGAGQLMNRTWGRAAVIFTIWLAAWVLHIVPIWTLACLGAGFEAGWSAVSPRRDAPTG